MIIFRFSHPDYPFTEDDVVLSFGCSGALYNSISAMCEEGDNILVPRPGFPLCLPIAQNLNINIKHYDLIVRNDLPFYLYRLAWERMGNKSRLVEITNRWEN